MTAEGAALGEVWIVGSCVEAGPQTLAAPLEGRAHWQSMATLEAAVELLKTQLPPELIVVAQSRPGELSVQAFTQLRTLAPLAGLCVVYGSWCEGETRTGKPWPGVWRCAWHEWPAQITAELARRAQGLPPLGALPATATPEERILARVPAVTSAPRGHAVAVVTSHAQAAESLTDALTTAGYAVVCCRPEDRIRAWHFHAVVWDTTLPTARDAAQVARLATRFPGARIIALVTFPRAHDLAAMQAAGIDTLLARPFLLENLLTAVE